MNARELGLVLTEESVVVSSLDVARNFEKEHKDVLKTIKSLECSEEFAERNFALGSYKDTHVEEITGEGLKATLVLKSVDNSPVCTLKCTLYGEVFICLIQTLRRSEKTCLPCWNRPSDTTSPSTSVQKKAMLY